MTSEIPGAKSTSTDVLPDTPGYPIARTLLAPAGEAPVLTSDRQSYADHVYTLDGAVVITYGDRRVQADHIEYDTDSGELTGTGHLQVTAGADSERITASHGTYNLNTATGQFFDVSGSVGLKASPSKARVIYTTSNPFLFTGRMMVKFGPHHYDIYDGTVTSCQLPHPDWLLSSSHFVVLDDKARARNSTFRLLNVPLIFLPYVTAPTDSSDRQSGVLIPTISQSSVKGLVLGEQIYFAINRSLDLTVGAEYFSSIGYGQNVTLRYKGPGLDFGTIHYAGVLDRRVGAANQGGEDVVLAARHDFTDRTRAAANIDYLSSYTFRQVFTDDFNQAVTSDIISTAYVAHEQHGFELTGLADRYQGIKTQTIAPTPQRPLGVPQQQVRIFHAPTIEFSGTDHLLPGLNPEHRLPFVSGLHYSFDLAAAGLKRSQNNFVTGGIIERIDLHPELSYPVALGRQGSAWHLLPTVAARETLYTRSRAQTTAPAQSPLGLSRSDFEFTFGVRPPVLERTFAPPQGLLQKIFGQQVRHTIEPELTYRLTDGVDNFSKVLRFDATDVASNTNEAEYGVTQRLFRRVAHPGPCQTEQIAEQPGFNSSAPEDLSLTADETGSAATPVPARTTDSRAPAGTGAGPCNRSEALISWRLTQKYFFDQTFGGAVVNTRRNIFDTTLDLSGIAFLTEAREISPLISRLRVRTSAHTDVEWDFDLDTGARRFTSSNVFADLHQGPYFSALSYARLDAPGRFYTQAPDSATGVTSAVSDFNQLRFLAGYGAPTKPGLSLAANVGLDLKSLYGATSTSAPTAANPKGVTTTVYPALLQYASVQTSYNWNCCGFAVEYRKFQLGSVRNEGTYKFSFTLANIGSAGNLRRAERLF